MQETAPVSIIISAYNAEKYIAATLDAVLQQTYPNLEIIVVNDGSTDNTLALAETYASRGVKLISQENKGQDAALNAGFKHARGKYIKFMDSDDLINPEMIALQVHALEGSDEYVAYGEWARFYNDQPGSADFTRLDYWKDMAPLDFLTSRPEGVMLQCGIMLIPRAILEKTGLWDERLILFNDTEFFTRVLLASKGVRFTKGARLYYRSGMAGSISAGRQRKFYESTFLATCLLGERLLEAEDSYRVRNLVSNTFLMQYYHMYPKFPDLQKKHEDMIRYYGHGTMGVDGGRVFKLLCTWFGWKFAKRVQYFFYRLGYLNLLYTVRKIKNKQGT
jgi:glycosyltransferase involved in cell wall biosynthesis